MDKLVLVALFASHLKIKTFHVTSDEQAFAEEHNASAHAASLEDKEVTEYDRKDFEDNVVNLPVVKKDKPATADKAAENAEKEALHAEYLLLFGKKANHMTGVTKLKAAIDVKKLELAEAAKKAEGSEEGPQ